MTIAFMLVLGEQRMADAEIADLIAARHSRRERNKMDAKLACAEVIQSWGLCRDQGKWPQLLATFVPEGQIAVSWFSGSFAEFVDRCHKAFDAGQRSKHHIFPSVVRVSAERAVAETSIVIHVRQKIDGVPVDMTSHARFLDRLERRDGRWAIVERTAIYERDRLDPVEPSDAFGKLFTATDLSIYPEAYRYMAARLVAAGRELAPVVYHDGLPDTDHLYTRYEAWLEGK
jgi:SnoaL-like domain